MRQRAEGVWELRVHAGAGRYVSRTIKGTRREAERALAHLVVEVDEGKTTPARGRTVATLANAWFDSRAPVWSPSHARNTRAWLDRLFLPQIGNMSLGKVRTEHIDAFYAVRRRAVSEATVRGDHTKVRSMFNQGVKWGWLGVNPAINTYRPSVPGRRITPPDPAAVVRLLDHVRLRDEAMVGFLILAADSGARLGQLCALQWDDISTENGTVSFTRTLTATGEIRPLSRSKGRARVIPLGAGTVRELEARQMKARELGLAFGVRLSKSAFVFSDDPACRTPWKVNVFKQRLLKLRREEGAGPAAAGMNFHQLRHYVATQLIAAGVDVRTVAERLGHSRASTTLDMYAAPVSEMGRAAADVLDSILRQARKD